MLESKNFEGDSFALQIMAVGSFVDDGCGNGKLYQVEATTVRLNHVALNEYLSALMLNVRDCYDTDEEWEAHKVKMAARMEAWEAHLFDALGVDPLLRSRGFKITQAQAEVFTVVHIWEISAETEGPSEAES